MRAIRGICGSLAIACAAVEASAAGWWEIALQADAVATLVEFAPFDGVPDRIDAGCLTDTPLVRSIRCEEFSVESVLAAEGLHAAWIGSVGMSHGSPAGPLRFRLEIYGGDGEITLDDASRPALQTAIIGASGPDPSGSHTVDLAVLLHELSDAEHSHIGFRFTPLTAMTGCAAAGGAIIVTLSCPECPFDFDRNGSITGDDIAPFLLAFDSGHPCGDVDRSGQVDMNDLLYFMSFWWYADC